MNFYFGTEKRIGFPDRSTFGFHTAVSAIFTHICIDVNPNLWSKVLILSSLTNFFYSTFLDVPNHTEPRLIGKILFYF